MTTQNLYVPQQGQLSDLAGWIAGDLGGARARLYVSNTPYLSTRVITDYTEASFPGYAPAGPFAWSAPFINGTNQAETDASPATWALSASSGVYVVFGILVVDSPGTKLLSVVPFVNPFNFTPTTPSLTYVLQMTETSKL